MWALRRTAESEFLRPGPCLDSPRDGWDSLNMERLPPPVDQAGPRPGPGQRGGGRDEGGAGVSAGGGRGAQAGSAPASRVTNVAGGGGGGMSAGVSTMFRIARHSRDRGEGSRAAYGADGGSSGFTHPVEAWYRVAAAEGVRVRQGADPQSPEVGMLGEGTELAVAEEIQDGNGGIWMRLSSPVKGWIGRRENSVEALSRGPASMPSGSVAGGSIGGVGSGRVGMRAAVGGGGGVCAGHERDGNENEEATEIALAQELEDCMEEEAGTELYRRDDRLFGSRQGWSLPSGGGSGLGVAGSSSGTSGGAGSASRTASHVPGERRAAVVGHARVSGCWAAVSGMPVAAAKEKLASTAATLAVLHCRKILLTVLLQCHKEAMRTTSTAGGGQAVADAALSQRVAALVGARDSPTASSLLNRPAADGGEGMTPARASPTTLRTRAASRQFSSFLQLVLFRGWRPGWWPLADGGGGGGGRVVDAEDAEGDDESGDDYGCLDEKEPMSDCFRSLPVVVTPLVLSLLRAAAAHRAATAATQERSEAISTASSSSVKSRGPAPSSHQRSMSFGAHVEEAMLQSVASQLRRATHIGYRDHAWASSDAAEMSDAHCLRYPRLRYVSWAARVVQAGSGASAVPRRIFHAWTTGLRSPSLPVKQQVCAELSRLLDEAVQAVDRAHRAIQDPAPNVTRASEWSDAVDDVEGDNSAVTAMATASAAVRRLQQCVELLPLDRLRSLAERRMLKEGEDEPMLSRALQSIVDLVASAEFASKVLGERQQALADMAVGDGKEEKKQHGDDTKARVATADTAAKSACALPQAPSACAEASRSVLCFPSSSAYVALQGRDLEPPWTAEFWVLRPNEHGTWDDEGRDANGDNDTDNDDDDEVDDKAEEHLRAMKPPEATALNPSPKPAGRRGIRKSYSERMPRASPAVATLPSMSRGFSTPTSSVDLSQLPPTNSEGGAPTLSRMRSADAVGQSGLAGDNTGAAKDGRQGESDKSSPALFKPQDFPPLPASLEPSGAAAVQRRGDGHRQRRSGPSATSDSGPSGDGEADGDLSDGKGGSGSGDGMPSFTAAYSGTPAASKSAGRKARRSWASSPFPSPWDAQAGSPRPGTSGGDGARAGSGAMTRSDSAVRRGEIGTEPAEYLASSQAGHIRIQAGGTVYAASVSQARHESGDGGRESGAEGGVFEVEDGDVCERAIHSEALCVSMGVTGEKERAFDFVVPTGRWVHLAIVASSPVEARTTLYVDGVPVDTVSLRMSLPMGYLGTAPPSQGSSTAAPDGGSFVGLLAQTRYA